LISTGGNSPSGVGIGTSCTVYGNLIEAETAEGPFEGSRIAVVEHHTK
jgi:hypothetical protein